MVDYKKTLNLPKTDFEMRAGLAKKEPQILAQWTARDLYGEIQRRRQGAPLYVLHDGPPYANGHLHHGHILNKVLKDIVVKDRTMTGQRCAYIPGWDCHGLPIEQQVDKRLGKKKLGMSKDQIRRECRAYADEFVAIQRDEFKRLGVLGRWDAPYKTMAYAYEAQILRELSTFVRNGLLYKGLRAVNWCTTHRTALAEAEVEYEDHESYSIYVAFPLCGDTSRLAVSEPVDILIWTTTPWTLPANLAIALHKDLDYIVYPVAGRPRLFARGMAESFLHDVGESSFDAAKVLGEYKGADLEGLTYLHVLFDRASPVILADHVTLEAGTGCVHTAPGHGAEDFDAGRKYGLDVLSPVDAAGVFTEEAGPFAGKHVFAANADIVAALVDKGALLNNPEDRITHRYAHCWRCHQPIIMRATEQWWVAMDEPFAGGATLRQRALGALGDVEWIPAWGENRIRGMLEARPDWCLSRQRTWGVPIAVFYCEKCDAPRADTDLMNKVADVFENEGADAWHTHSVEELVGALKCGACGGGDFRKESDILDVWFDSGVSFAAVIEREGEGHRDGPPVDLCLEGSDQHRGWFHTSLLCSLATRERPPYRKVVTHGFIVDNKGKKISKSAGNAEDPFVVIKRSGAELLRLWVAAEDFRNDIRLTGEVLNRLTDTYRKVRNTLRYLLGNLDGFDPNHDMVAPDELVELDLYALVLTHNAVERMAAAYRTTTFHQVVQTASELCTVDLSSFYLDILKDRLYCSAPTSEARRSAQTALYSIARDLLRMLAPVLCFTAEEAWGHLPRLAGDPNSVHLATYPGIDEPRPVNALRRAVATAEQRLTGKYSKFRGLRGRGNASLEAARRDKVIGSSVEAALVLSASGAQREKLEEFGVSALADFFIVSGVSVNGCGAGDADAGAEIGIAVVPADGTKCERCWLYRGDIGQSSQHPTLCARCAEAVSA